MPCPGCGSRAISYQKSINGGHIYACRAKGTLCQPQEIPYGDPSSNAWQSGATIWVSGEAAQEMLDGAGRYSVSTISEGTPIPEGPCAALLVKIIAWKDGQVGYLHELIEEARKIVSGKNGKNAPRNAYGHTEAEQKEYDKAANTGMFAAPNVLGQYKPLTPGLGAASIGGWSDPNTVSYDELSKMLQDAMNKHQNKKK